MTIVMTGDEVRIIIEEDANVRDLMDTFGGSPGRGGRVEVLSSGPYAGLWIVDFIPMFERTGEPKYNCCLPELFATRAEAVAAERQWLEEHFLGITDEEFANDDAKIDFPDICEQPSASTT